MPLADDLRAAMRTGGTLRLEFAEGINALDTGVQRVYLNRTGNDEITASRNGPGEETQILWLRYRQGTIERLAEFRIEEQPADTLFMTYYLTGCKLFAIRNGPVWHIEANSPAAEFGPVIQNDDWVQDYGAGLPVAYLHRAGQPAQYWNLAGYFPGIAPSTYGNGNNTGQAVVAGIVNGASQLDLYYQASPWAPLQYGALK